MMRGRTYLSEATVLEAHDRVTAALPTTLSHGGASLELELPGRPHRLVGRLAATRFEGRWGAGRRKGPWRVDVVPAGSWGALLTVVVEGWRGRGGEELAAEIARELRDRAEGRFVAQETQRAAEEVQLSPVWETGSP